jgi:hypothetical protein
MIHRGADYHYNTILSAVLVSTFGPSYNDLFLYLLLYFLFVKRRGVLECTASATSAASASAAATYKCA